MQPKSAKLLEDIRDSAQFICDVTQGVTLQRWAADRVLRQAVERNFEIIGEAVKRLSAHDPATAARIGHQSQIVGFRNVLIHGYDLVDYALVLNTAANQVPQLLGEVTALLAGR